jgi:endonuclease/exonuclease/phosphatase family metal-dependent hydrolase
MPFAVLLLGLILLLIAIRAYTAKNYLEKNSPSFSRNYAVENSGLVDAITVISYNIWFGLKPERAISELKEFQSRHPLDILLLQEMDDVSTEKIAHELQLNYVYYPAAIEPTYHKNFGNAILSRWPVLDPQKLILPHRSFSNRMNRTATSATLRIRDVDVRVYSIHTESIFTLLRFREDQYEAILKDFGPDTERVIIGGDFNSFTEPDVQNIERIFRQAGFLRASATSGHTVIKYGIGVSADHIFTKGFVLKEAGRIDGATASDHLPIWVTLTPG